MKKLQSNYTTPEQSRRLLELGVPEWTADVNFDTLDNVARVRYEDDFFIGFGIKGRDIPCWSVGRLREIFCICSSVNGTREYPFCNDQVAWWITEFEFKKEFIDFSKLED